ncbi:crossover junction endodeoxyribonuclease RuvC [Peptoniphilus indolicus]|uniref:Crossover junction endodeoxyribonuclease RuvC n=2 Tax=Peptoniphilus indolicus TaxID=33030 RepID=G4D5U2_9FIRM|nr:crossover junction endodeoxyribonuclease RuvC [Peptoniphilus indolicus]EGY78164.1 crossover junction endoribonuclease subunit C [Peptoniphilus indolicus ATCC 29427]SUB76147.1 Crossover junction endodeoxyribonuclease RuvC [Peptoniphilus indolicus]
MRILGIDPGYAIVGYGIIDVIGNSLKPVTYGTITTDKDLTFPKRLEKIYVELTYLIEKYKPNDIAFEELFFNKNTKTAIQVAEARGVEILAVKLHVDEIYEYTPLQIKDAIVGYGRAEKRQVQEMVKMILGLSKIPKPDDVADALAVAITHSSSVKFKELFRME